MNSDQQVLFEALKRTDSYIVSADQKASFLLAAGVTYLGIYTSLFYGFLSDKSLVILNELTLSVIGVLLVTWSIWFYKIKTVFTPRLKSSGGKSLISYASMINNHNDVLDCFCSYESLKNNNFDLDKDLLENYWICAEICNTKMLAFKSSLLWLFFTLSGSVLGLAILAFYSTFFS
ncbi:hypothetical protein [Vibrio sp. Hep-1b-8]|uniref:hypothetical protein n=1 Tax=Vibrio sp. Hep-1b-8 TaxID=2144187 RepID=UPI001110B5DA|nr:hypothetical protein [Vibrio sp. Hep-1b-8]TMX37483.1 hypothetical protein DA100_11390 [Vibrio sp. Hep-1b-8]